MLSITSTTEKREIGISLEKLLPEVIYERANREFNDSHFIIRESSNSSGGIGYIIYNGNFIYLTLQQAKDRGWGQTTWVPSNSHITITNIP